MRGWLTWTLAALVSWGVWAVLSKVLGAGLSAEQSQAWSTLGFLPVVLPLAWGLRGRWRSASRRGLWLAAAGGVVSCLGNIPYYAAMARGERFATVLSLAALAPLVTVLLAMGLLRERLSRVQWLGLPLAGLAIWLFNVPDGAAVFSPAIWVALAPTVLWGISGFLQKLATNHVSGEAAAGVYLGAFLPMGVWYGVGQPWPGGLGVGGWMAVLGLGFFLAFGNFAVLAAFARQGKAAVIAPLVNLFPVVSLGIALLMGERLSGREGFGIAVALASVLALSWEPAASPDRQGVPATTGFHEEHR